MSSEEAAAVQRKMLASSEMDDILHWMRHHGVDLGFELTSFSKEISRVPEIVPSSSNMQQFSLRTFAEEIESQIDLPRINKVIDELLKQGNDLAQLYLILNVSRPALEQLFQDQQIKSFVKTLTNFGIDSERLKSLLYELLRW